MSSTSLDQAVDQAEETYRAFRLELKSLISVLKAHHEAMLKLNSTQKEVRKEKQTYAHHKRQATMMSQSSNSNSTPDDDSNM